MTDKTYNEIKEAMAEEPTQETNAAFSMSNPFAETTDAPASVDFIQAVPHHTLVKHLMGMMRDQIAIIDELNKEGNINQEGEGFRLLTIMLTQFRNNMGLLKAYQDLIDATGISIPIEHLEGVEIVTP